MSLYAAEQRRKKLYTTRRSEATFRGVSFFRVAQGSLPQAGQVNGCTFFAASLLVRFFMQVKK
jgi:hypothetical protein